MIEILDELTEVSFDIYWNKYIENNFGYYNKVNAQMQWFYMHELDRINAFTNISKGIFIQGQQPIEHLKSFCL